MIKSYSSSYLGKPPPAPRLVRHFVANALRFASALLERLAANVEYSNESTSSEKPPTELEFYAESGAPEGAIYANGKLLGYVTGVNRL